MREIEFRGYSVPEMVGNQWLYGFGVMDIDYVDGTVEYHLHTLNGTYEVHPKSIGQYTGLKDKNGKKIYEGDVVEVDNTWRNKVRYWKGCFMVDDDILGAIHSFSEVVGNVYENPELI